MTSIYFHEDDFCQIEILPIENLGFCLKQAGCIEEFAKTHKSGIGYTDMYVRDETPLSLADKKIVPSQLKNALQGITKEFDEVYSGYSSYREKCEFTHAFGNDKNIVLFFDVKNGIVKNIWLTLDTDKEDDILTAKNIFSALSRIGSFIIADWGWSYIEDIGNHLEIEKYLRQRLIDFTQG